MTRVVLVALLLLVTSAAADLGAQSVDLTLEPVGLSLEQVRWALDRRLDDDAAADQLEEWGDAALPFLAELIDHEEWSVRFDVLMVLANLETPGSTELLLTAVELPEIHERFSPDLLEYLEAELDTDELEALVSPFEDTAFRELVRRAVQPGTRELVRGERYRTVMLAVADRLPATAEVQDGIARVIAVLEWREELPRLRALLEHDDDRVRDTAAEALRLLTGEAPGHVPPRTVFPAVALDPTLVEHVGMLDEAYVNQFAFGRWGDAQRLVLPTGPMGIEIRDEHLERVQHTLLDEYVWAVLPAPTTDGGQQLICALGRDDDEPAGDSIAGLDPGGRPLWRRSLDGGSFENMAPFYRDGEVAGVLVDVEENDDTFTIALLDLDGEVSWSFSVDHDNGYYVAQPRLFSHPAFRSLVTLVGEDWYAVLDGQGEPYVAPDPHPVAAFLLRVAEVALPLLLPEPEPMWLTQALPVPRGPDRYAMIEAGYAGVDARPTLRRVDVPGTQTWTATLPSPVEGLCLIEPGSADGPWLIVAATLSGEFFVVQDDGTLVHRGRFEETRLSHGADSAEVMLTGIISGRLGDQRAFAISAWDFNVYRLP